MGIQDVMGSLPVESHKFPEHCFAQDRKHHYVGQLAVSIFMILHGNYLWI